MSEARKRVAERPISVGDAPSITTWLDEDIWRGFVDKHPNGNVFQMPEMYEVFSQTRNHTPSLWASTDADGAPLALLLPVEINLAGGLLRPFTSRAVVYGGLLVADDPVAIASVSPLLEAYRRRLSRQALFTEVRHVSDPAELLPRLRANGFSHEGHLNYLIRLDRSETELWDALSKTAKQRVRSAGNKGVRVEEVADARGVTEAYGLLEQTYGRAGVPLADVSLFQAVFAVLRPRNMARIIAARLDGRLIGVRFLLVHGRRIIDWYAGFDRAFSSFSPNEALVWSALQWGRERGLNVFDFGGAGRPDERYGPREFKSKFGGRLVDHGRDVLVHAPWRLGLSRAAYAGARRMPRRRSNRGGNERG